MSYKFICVSVRVYVTLTIKYALIMYYTDFTGWLLIYFSAVSQPQIKIYSCLKNTKKNMGTQNHCLVCQYLDIIKILKFKNQHGMST